MTVKVNWVQVNYFPKYFVYNKSKANLNNKGKQNFVYGKLGRVNRVKLLVHCANKKALSSYKFLFFFNEYFLL